MRLVDPDEAADEGVPRAGVGGLVEGPLLQPDLAGGARCPRGGPRRSGCRARARRCARPRRSAGRPRRAPAAARRASGCRRPASCSQRAIAASATCAGAATTQAAARRAIGRPRRRRAAPRTAARRCRSARRVRSAATARAARPARHKPPVAPGPASREPMHSRPRPCPAHTFCAARDCTHADSSKDLRPASSSTAMPSSSALSSLLPASSPATT